jgi:hypothetical protein
MNTLKIKRSSVPGKIPTHVQLPSGELAINTSDEKMFFGSDTRVVELARINDIKSNLSERCKCCH